MGGGISWTKKERERKRHKKRAGEGDRKGGLGGGYVKMHGNDLSKHAFLLHPKSHRNFDPCVIKAKCTLATVSISGLGALLLFVYMCVLGFTYVSKRCAPICFGSTCTV